YDRKVTTFVIAEVLALSCLICFYIEKNSIYLSISASIMDIIADCKCGKLGKQKNEIGFNENSIRGRMIMYVNQEKISMLRLCSRLLLQQKTGTQSKCVSRNGWLFFYLVSS